MLFSFPNPYKIEFIFLTIINSIIEIDIDIDIDKHHYEF